jgi:hypothetical protein
VQIGYNSIENIDTIDRKTLKIEQKHTIFYCFDTIDAPLYISGSASSGSNPLPPAG